MCSNTNIQIYTMPHRAVWCQSTNDYKCSRTGIRSHSYHSHTFVDWYYIGWKPDLAILEFPSRV